MDLKISLQYVGKVIIFIILTVFLDVNSKENQLESLPKSEPNLGNNGGKMNGLQNQDARQQNPQIKAATIELRAPAQDQHMAWNHRHITKDQCIDEADTECSEMGGNCIKCNFEDALKSCNYGSKVNVSCNVDIVCKGDRKFLKEIICQYCYQTPLSEQVCDGYSACNSVSRNFFRANCTVLSNVICLGSRKFNRNLPCNWKNGYRWSTAFILSITLGGFGADRFYLGRWQEGIGKLFSFGGLGLWTIVDIILIGVRYLGPADGSVFVD